MKNSRFYKKNEENPKIFAPKLVNLLKDLTNFANL